MTLTVDTTTQADRDHAAREAAYDRWHKGIVANDQARADAERRAAERMEEDRLDSVCGNAYAVLTAADSAADAAQRAYEVAELVASERAEVHAAALDAYETACDNRERAARRWYQGRLAA